MAYEKQNWVNLPSQTTPLSADRLNHLETGIEDAHEQLDGRLSEAGLSATFADKATAVQVGTTAAVPDGGGFGVNVEDSATNTGIPIHLEHNGSGNGLDLRNWPGAGTAFVVHQYSNTGPAVRLDNTGTGTMLLIAQTNNPVHNPNSEAGTAATGAAIRQVDHTGASYFTLQGRGEVQMNVPNDANFHALEIVGNPAVAKRLVKLTANSASQAIEIIQNVAGTYAATIIGKTYGLAVTVTDSTGSAMRLTRSNGSGGGDGLDIRMDSAVGRPLLIRRGTSEVAIIANSGEYENLVAGAGIVLKSPNGTRYRVGVSDAGVVTAVAA